MDRLTTLLGSIHDLSLARDLETVQQVVRRVRAPWPRLTGATFVLRDNGQQKRANAG